LFLFLLFERLKAFVFFLKVEGSYFYSSRSWKFLFLLLEVEGSNSCSWKSQKLLFFFLQGWRVLFLFLKRLKVFVFTLKKVESFCSCFWMFKVFVVSLNVEGSCSYFWMLKVLTPPLECSKLLLLVLNVAFHLRYWKFFLLCFLCYKAKLSFCFSPSTSKLCIQSNIFQKYLNL